MAISQFAGRSKNDLSYARILYNNKISSASTEEASALLIPNTWERYESASGTVNEDFAFSSASKINAIGIAAHNLGTAGAQLTLSLSKTNPFTTAVKTVTLTPRTNKPIMFIFDDEDDILSLRLTVSGGVDREIGVLYAGEAMVMQSALYGGHSPMALSDITEYRNAISETGNFLERKIKRKGQQTSFSWRFLEPDWYREVFQSFVESAKTTPFFIMWRPDNHIDEVAYGFTTSDIKPTNMSVGSAYLEVSMTVRGHSE